jgi:RNA polymerase sigma-70 factor (ECF subfamily)
VRNEDHNPDLFEELAMPLFASLYNFAHWQTHNREEAEDLVQETYAKALKGFGSFQPGTNFRAWMFRILRNTFLTSRTGLIRTNTVPLDDENEENILPAVQETPESLFFQHSTQLQVEKAISELQPHYQEVLLLADVEEMSYLEIAETLSIPIGTVMSRLSRARGMVRNSLKQSCKE